MAALVVGHGALGGRAFLWLGMRLGMWLGRAWAWGSVARWPAGLRLWLGRLAPGRLAPSVCADWPDWGSPTNTRERGKPVHQPACGAPHLSLTVGAQRHGSLARLRSFACAMQGSIWRLTLREFGPGALLQDAVEARCIS